MLWFNCLFYAFKKDKSHVLKTTVNRKSVAKRAWKSISLDTKILVFRQMEAGETVLMFVIHCLMPAIVFMIMDFYWENIKEPVQKTTKLCAPIVSYTLSSTIEQCL